MMLQKIFNKKHFSSLFENANVGMLLTDSDGVIRAVNKYILSEFGYDAKEILNKKVEILIPEEFRAEHVRLREDYKGHPRSYTVPSEKSLMGRRRDGTKLPLEMAIGYYRDEDEIYLLAIFCNIGYRKVAEETIQFLNAELDQKIKESTRSLNATVDQLIRQIKENERKDAELLKALEKEKELNQLKSRFVSVASHEFRTPLSGILASTYLLAKYTKTDDQPQRDKHIKRIMSSVSLLNEVLGDFLSVDKMEQDNFKPNPTRFDIDDVMKEIIHNMQYMLKKGQIVDYVHSGDSKIAYIDQSMFQHIMSNLISNAIKYSFEDSTIKISIDQNDPTLIIRVKDHGIGIPKNEQENLFKRFFRSTNAVHIEGTGLGLNIVKKYVEVMDGKVECFSEMDKGTEFVITFNNQSEHYEDSIGS
jgi:PAS domain S-box-containing protein